MKQNIMAAFAAAASILMAVSCQKQEPLKVQEQEQARTETVGDGVSFTATIDQNLTKTTITEERKVEWVSDDRISVNGAEYAAVPGVPASEAKFVHKDGDAPQAPYKAIYPATLYNASTGGYVLPSTIAYKNGLNTPMYAESDTEKLSFKNICGVLCLSLAGTEKVKSISVTADKNICGPFTVETAEDGTVSMALTGADTDANKSVTLDFGENPVELYNNYLENVPHNDLAAKFYIPIPKGTYNHLVITVAIDNVPKPELRKFSTESITIETNTLYTLDWDIVVPIAEQLSYVFRDMADNQPKFAVASGEATMSGQFGDNPFLPAIHTWEYNYAAIEKIDHLMYMFDEQETVQGWTASELRFFRALLYFELFKTYGEIPILPDSTPLSFGEIVEFITNELEGGAMAGLPERYDEEYKTVELGNGIEITRPTIWAAMSLLARTGLYYYSPLFSNGDIDLSKQDAIEYYGKIVSYGPFRLLNEYLYWWGGTDESGGYFEENDNLVNDELIFAVRYTGPYFEGVFPSQSQVDLYYADWYNDGRSYFIFDWSDATPTEYPLKKGIATGKNTHVLPIFRYGATLLELAELTGDQQFVNEVRKRAGTPETYPYSVIECFNERRRELAYEGQYFWDVRRWMRGEDLGDNWDDAYYFYPRPSESAQEAEGQPAQGGGQAAAN